MPNNSNQPRATPVRFVVSPARRIHILYGDKTGGGHRFGANKGKTEFPRNWRDDDIIRAIEEVANDPASSRFQVRGGKTAFIGVRNSVRIRVIIDVMGREILTGHPT